MSGMMKEEGVHAKQGNMGEGISVFFLLIMVHGMITGQSREGHQRKKEKMSAFLFDILPSS